MSFCESLTLLLRITTQTLKCARHVVSCHAFPSQLSKKQAGQTSSSIKRMASESPSVVASLSNESRPTGSRVRTKLSLSNKGAGSAVEKENVQPVTQKLSSLDDHIRSLTNFPVNESDVITKVR